VREDIFSIHRRKTPFTQRRRKEATFALVKQLADQERTKQINSRRPARSHRSSLRHHDPRNNLLLPQTRNLALPNRLRQNRVPRRSRRLRPPPLRRHNDRLAILPRNRTHPLALCDLRPRPLAQPRRRTLRPEHQRCVAGRRKHYYQRVAIQSDDEDCKPEAQLRAG
jgi:hypothetical protein